MKKKSKFLSILGVFGICLSFSLFTISNNNVRNVNAITDSELDSYYYTDFTMPYAVSGGIYDNGYLSSIDLNISFNFNMGVYYITNNNYYVLPISFTNCKCRCTWFNEYYLDGITDIQNFQDYDFPDNIYLDNTSVIRFDYGFNCYPDYAGWGYYYCKLYINDVLVYTSGISETFVNNDDNIEFTKDLDLEQSIPFKVCVESMLNGIMNSNNTYTSGYDNGYNVGKQDGILSGYNSGYSDGYNDGYDAEPVITSIFNGILNVALVPINFFLSIFNFEILGINMSAFVSAILTICLIIIVVKSITGKGSGGDD